MATPHLELLLEVMRQGMRQHTLAQWLREEAAAKFGICAGYAPHTPGATTELWTRIPPERTLIPLGDVYSPTVAPDCNPVQVKEVGFILERFSYCRNDTLDYI